LGLQGSNDAHEVSEEIIALIIPLTFSDGGPTLAGRATDNPIWTLRNMTLEPSTVDVGDIDRESRMIRHVPPVRRGRGWPIV
jgi:hypothetical protein